jgi:hypothetical protein
MEYQHVILITILLLIFYLMTSNQCQNRYGDEYLSLTQRLIASEKSKSKESKDKETKKKSSTCAIM